MKKALLILILTAAFGSVCYGQWGCMSAITFDHADSGLTGFVNWPQAITIDTIHFHHNIWQVSQPHKTVFDSAYSYPDGIVTDTLNPYPPNNTSVFTLTFPGRTTSGCWIFGFGFYYQLNIDSTSIAKIEFSPDSGATWINLRYHTTIGIINPDTLFDPTPGWHGWSAGIDSIRLLSNDSLKFKFTFISGNDTTGKDGWMIDNIAVDYRTESVPTLQNPTTLTIFPNPATTQLTIQLSGPVILSGVEGEEVSITNIFGQTVYLQTAPASCQLLQIDVSSFPTGIYFVKVNGEVRKFLKE